MEGTDILQAIISLADSVSTIAILIFAWYQERLRADRLTIEIVDDWKRQNAKEN